MKKAFYKLIQDARWHRATYPHESKVKFTCFVRDQLKVRCPDYRHHPYRQLLREAICIVHYICKDEGIHFGKPLHLDTLDRLFTLAP